MAAPTTPTCRSSTSATPARRRSAAPCPAPSTSRSPSCSTTSTSSTARGPTVVYCAGGYRSSIAASTLRAHGFQHRRRPDRRLSAPGPTAREPATPAAPAELTGPTVRALLASPLGFLIGLSLGALGGGGSILAVPVLVYAAGPGPPGGHGHEPVPRGHRPRSSAWAPTGGRVGSGSAPGVDVRARRASADRWSASAREPASSTPTCSCSASAGSSSSPPGACSRAARPAPRSARQRELQAARDAAPPAGVADPGPAALDARTVVTVLAGRHRASASSPACSAWAAASSSSPPSPCC